MGLFSNIKSAIDDKSSMSVNSVSVLTSAFMTFIIGLTACFVLVYDVTYDGKVDTDMSDLAWFIVAGSSCILGSGLPKAYIDSRMKTRSWIDGEKLQVEMDENEYLKSNRKGNSKKNTSDEEEMGES
jgi:hypothetical protein